MRVAFIGLGTMGAPMAGHLAAAGHEVAVHNRTTAKAEAWVADHGGRSGATPAEAAAGASVIITMLPNGAIVRGVHAEIVAAARPGALLVDCSTIDVESARAVHDLALDAEQLRRARPRHHLRHRLAHGRLPPAACTRAVAQDGVFCYLRLSRRPSLTPAPAAAPRPV